MVTPCGACGWENEAAAARCGGCGVPLASHGPPRNPPHGYGPGPAVRSPVQPPPTPQRAGPPAAPADPSVPRRSIPVRVAAPRGGAGPVPWRGGAVGLPPTAAGPPAYGQVSCPDCGRAAPADRRFCACGALLAPVAATAAQPVPRAPGPWGEWSAHREFRRAMRAAGGGSTPSYDAPVAASVRLVRVLLVLLVVGLAGSQVGPWGAEVRAAVADALGPLLPGSLTG